MRLNYIVNSRAAWGDRTLWETDKQGAVRYPGGDAEEEVGGPNGGEAMAGI